MQKQQAEHRIGTAGAEQYRVIHSNIANVQKNRIITHSGMCKIANDLGFRVKKIKNHAHIVDSNSDALVSAKLMGAP